MAATTEDMVDRANRMAERAATAQPQVLFPHDAPQAPARVTDLACAHEERAAWLLDLADIHLPTTGGGQRRGFPLDSSEYAGLIAAGQAHATLALSLRTAAHGGA